MNYRRTDNEGGEKEQKNIHATGQLLNKENLPK
jgi:hypothetical protein